MTFRRRVALLVAVAVAVVATAVVSSLYVVVRAQLRDQVERELRDVAAVVRSAAGAGVLPAPQGGQAQNPPNLPRIVDADGTVVQTRMPSLTLPVSGEARAVAAGERESSLETLRHGDDRFAVMTVSLRPGQAVQIVRSLAPVDELLDRLLRTSLAAAATVVVLAPVVGSVVAGRALVPVRQLSRVAEDVATTGDLQPRAEARGDDELGSLATSFNAVLDRLEDMVGTLERAQRAQRQLVADASHELRTPLTTLRTNVEVLSLEPAMPADDRASLAADTVSQIDNLTGLIGQLIDLAREDEREPVRTPVRLDKVVEDTLDRARRHHPDVDFVADLEPTTVLGAADALASAVGNLLDNAGSWSPDSATVEVRLSDGVLEVRDHGPGIDDADLPHVFQRFYRGSGSRRRPGSGLGLAIVEQVVVSHGGDVTAGAAPGGGALFRVALPVSDP